MREMVVISGKGGTGKTSITASLAALAQPLVLADCDVDAPDLHLLTDPQIQRREPFTGGKKARIVADECLQCGRCAAICRFDAIHLTKTDHDTVMAYTVDSIACEGCGACVSACPADAIRFEPVVNGEWYISETRFGPMVHARLHPGEENSGKLVTTVRREARRVAASAGLDVVLVDGSPGIGCPVIASMTNADLALIVAEPTPTGIHDALRVMELAGQMNISILLCTNRWDLNPSRTEELESEGRKRGATVVGRIRDDSTVVDAQMNGLSIVEWKDSPSDEDVRSVWKAIQEHDFFATRSPERQTI